MNNNGTDRDVAMSFVSLLNDITTLLGSLNDNLFVPHIITQPTNQTGAVDSNVVFSVVANNVRSYAWQYKTNASTTWRDMHSGTTGSDTDTITIPVTATRYTYSYRCHITGKDGSEINTDTVQILEPAPEPEG